MGRFSMSEQTQQSRQNGTSVTRVVVGTVVAVSVAGGAYLYYVTKDMTRDEIYLRAVGKILSTEWGVSLGKYLLERHYQSKKPETPKPSGPSLKERLVSYFYGEESPVTDAVEPVA